MVSLMLEEICTGTDLQKLVERTSPSPQVVFKELTWVFADYDKDFGFYFNTFGKAGFWVIF